MISKATKNKIELVHLEEAYSEMKNVAEFRKKCIDFYRGDQLGYIDQYCHFTDPIRQNQMQKSFTNITQKIINRVCLTYLNVPTRTIEQGEERQAKYNRRTKKKRAVMTKLDRYSELLDRIGLKLEWNAEKEMIKYRPIIDNIYFEFDQYGDEPIEVYFPISPCALDVKNGHKLMYEYWNINDRYILDFEGKPSKYQQAYGFTDNKNHYGRIPVIPIEKDGLYAKGLINANENINASLTQLNELVKYKSFGVPFASGVSSNDTIEYNIDAFIKLDSGDKAGMLSPAALVTEVIEAIKFQVQLIAENYGVTFNWSIVGNVSGFSLMVQNVELYDQLKIDNEIKREWEDKIFELENRIIEIDAKGTSYGDTIDIDFVEYSMPVNNAEQDAHEKHLLATGQTNPIELMMKKNPDLDEKEARKKYEENIAFIKTNTQATTPTDPLDEALTNVE